MRKLKSVGRVLASGALLMGIATATPGCPSEDETETVELACDAGNEAFVKRAMLALNGRHAYSQDEVQVWVDIITKLEEKGVDPMTARREAALAMMQEPDTFRVRWSEFFMDSLYVLRSVFARGSDSWFDKVQATACYGPKLIDAKDGGALAAYVRDNPPESSSPPFPSFGLGRLMASSLALDDLSPIYRTQLFHMVQFPMAGANLSDLDREEARRRDFGTTFQDAYIHRDALCVNCHNAVASPTSHPNPELNRHWPLEGRLEQAVFGEDNAPADPLRYWSVFRVQDVRDDGAADSEASSGAIAPWGWNRGDCGGFAEPSPSDPLNVEAQFASVDGQWASVWGLEASLHSGFDKIRGKGLNIEADDLVDSDAAFAYLVSANIVEKVWEEIMGSGLTVAHKYPRNQHQRDTLDALTSNFIRSSYSLKTLLADIVTHPYFNLPATESWCDNDPYSLDPLLNPWSIDEADAERRGNGAGDRIHALSTALVQKATHWGLEWNAPEAFPKDTSDEQARTAIGLFVSKGRPGFRGLGFQPKLSWEDQYGVCSWPGYDDFVSKLLIQAQQTPGATLREVVIALKDRLIDEPFVDPSEAPALEAIFGQELDTPVEQVADLESPTRVACGAYLASPQTLLGGMAPPVGFPSPRLTPPEHGYDASCNRTVEAASKAGLLISCLGGTLTVSRF